MLQHLRKGGVKLVEIVNSILFLLLKKNYPVFLIKRNTTACAIYPCIIGRGRNFFSHISFRDWDQNVSSEGEESFSKVTKLSMQHYLLNIYSSKG